MDYLKGIYHYAMSTPYLLGNSEERVVPTITEAPDVGLGGIVSKTAKAAKAATKLAKAAKIEKAAEETVDELENAAKVANAVKRSRYKGQLSPKNNPGGKYHDYYDKRAAEMVREGTANSEREAFDILRDAFGKEGIDNAFRNNYNLGGQSPEAFDFIRDLYTSPPRIIK